MNFENLIYSVEEGIATITLNRPKALNALNSALLTELSTLIDSIANDSSVQAAIITGAGEKAFVAGADISEMHGKSPLEARGFSQFGNAIFRKIEQLPQPVIAAVNGFALGGGCELAMACDIRVASTNAKFGQPEVNLGIVAGFGGTQRLPRLVGPGIAKELLMTGDMITADRAAQIGLVNHVVAPEELLGKAKEIAAKMLSKAPFAVQFSKKLVNEGFNMDLDRALAMESEVFGTLFGTEDRLEGMTAFLEKRSANFKAK
ncbi:enoyl-CoA hydratase-related protein [Effusibacillus lacus]|uniref:Crotonase n=1 Tax=Effusibacillus lacus TaxID=1348429 RepID=A0A292YKX4_9BACL|nr:enoyl-CoA hydratase-related protein [Effusibacillus lacus]TCS70485.1 enoyl-CoA hydratase [Effusibacillus lacus]GAX89561.1 crotonase [Effusibacillus lacus]